MDLIIKFYTFIKKINIMPTPKKNESKNDFIKRCIVITQRDGAAKNTKQAIAICNSLWDKKE